MDWFDFFRPGHPVIRRIKGGLDLPAGFSVEGSTSTESHDPGVAVSKGIVLQSAKGGRGPPRMMIVPEAGIGLKSKTPYFALMAQRGRATLVVVKEPYRDGGSTTMGTHVIFSVNLRNLLKAPSYKEFEGEKP